MGVYSFSCTFPQIPANFRLWESEHAKLILLDLPLEDINIFFACP
jgi:hypothetical protein